MPFIPTSASSWSTSWSYWLGASALAIAGARAGTILSRSPESYVQFTVGGSTFRNANKHADFAVLVGLSVAFVAAWLFFLLLERRIHRQAGEEGVSGARALIGYACLPLLLWAAGLVIGTSQRLDFAYVSAVAVACAGVLLLAATLRSASVGGSTSPSDIAGLTLIGMVLGVLSALILPFAVNRLLVLTDRAPAWTGAPSPPLLALVGAGLVLIVSCWACCGGERTDVRMSRVLIAAQLALPWAYLLALPLPWQTADGVFDALPTGRGLAIVLALVAATYVDLGRRVLRGSAPVRPLAMLSPLSATAALLFLKLPSFATSGWSPDDYHVGEGLLPMWTWVNQHAIPFWDYVPARGLVNYSRGVVATVVFGASTAAAIHATVGFMSIIFPLLGMLTIGRLVGVLPAAVALLVMPLPNTVSEIDYVNTATLVALVLAYGRLRASTWLVTWIVLSPCIFLWAPAQGSTVVLATIPLALWQVGRAFRHERKRLWNTLFATIPLALLLLLATPIGRVVLGAVRYGTEHAEVAGPAHGIEWILSVNAHGPVNRWLFEAVRTSWMIVPLSGIVFLGAALLSSSHDRRRPLLLIGLPIVLIGLLFIHRAAGRIDPDNVSRLGLASIWMLSLHLPLLLHAAWGETRWPAILALTVAGAGLVVPAFGSLDLRAAARRGLDAPPSADALVDGRAVGLPNLGVMPVDPDRLDDVQQIRRTLGILLDPGDTFLGLTERNALYFYLGRRLPVESGALYNLPNDRQQLRAIARIAGSSVPVVLAPDGPGRVMDGGPASLRSYAIYRYLVWRYVPVRVQGHLYLVKPDRLARLAAHPELEVETDRAPLFDSAFRQEDVAGLPSAWGASWGTLSGQATEVRPLASASTTTVLDHLQAIGANQYRATGPTPAVGWDFPSAPLAGKSAGLLVFDFTCLSRSGPVPLDVMWAASGSPFEPVNSIRLLAERRLVVPLDAAPRWLLAPSIGHLQIRLAEEATCSEFSLVNPTLWQRTIAAHTDSN